jgi:hypothetical protein
MTLVVARKFDDLTYLIADTGWIVPMTGERAAPIANPICKILPCRSAVIAYSGDTSFLPNLIDLSERINAFEELRDELTKVHLASACEIDFLVVDVESRDLWKIADGDARALEATHIGSSDAFGRFQAQRHATQNEKRTFMALALLPECSKENGAIYVGDLHAFSRTLEQERDDASGVAVPYFIDATKHTYGLYVAEIRQPLAWHETSEGLHRPINWQGAAEGAFSINFAGTSDSFAYHIRQCNLGIECCYRELGIEANVYKESERKFQISMESVRGIKLTSTTHSHPIDAIIHSLLLRRNGQLTQAASKITETIKLVLGSCTDMQGNKLDSDLEFLTDAFDKYSEIQVPLEYVSFLMQAIRLRYEYLVDSGLEEKIRRALKDYEIVLRAEEGMVTWANHNPAPSN